MIEGVQTIPLKRINTDNGDVLHALKATDEGYTGFGEAYFSEVFQGVRKGWKRHNRMTLNIVVVMGAIKFILYDDRDGSASQGKYFTIILSPTENYSRLVVPSGVWMAFEGVAPGVSMLLDIIPEPHDPNEADKAPIETFKE